MTNAVLNMVHNWAASKATNSSNNSKFRHAASELCYAIENILKFL